MVARGVHPAADWRDARGFCYINPATAVVVPLRPVRVQPDREEDAPVEFDLEVALNAPLNRAGTRSPLTLLHPSGNIERYRSGICCSIGAMACTFSGRFKLCPVHDKGSILDFQTAADEETVVPVPLHCRESRFPAGEADRGPGQMSRSTPWIPTNSPKSPGAAGSTRCSKA